MNKEFINKLIAFTGLTDKDFAARINVSTLTVRKWKKGETEPLFIN